MSAFSKYVVAACVVLGFVLLAFNWPTTASASGIRYVSIQYRYCVNGLIMASLGDGRVFYEIDPATKTYMGCR